MPLGPGDVIGGKYEVVRLIGEGGMGAVYEGKNRRLGRRVAIKVMHELGRHRPEVARRFEREARAAAKVQSEHVCDVLDLGDLESGEPYMVLEYLEGESLAERLDARGRLSPAESARVVYPLLEGLARMHAEGIVHRDLKPANVFLARSAGREVVKILDFGVSKLIESGAPAESMTETGAVLGTPLYMSPEQARGQTREVDARSDLYAVGVILYRCVAGAPPFLAENFQELIFKIVLESPPPLEERAPGCDAAFGALVRRAMARAPDDRFASAGDFQAALLAWSRGVGESLVDSGIAQASAGAARAEPGAGAWTNVAFEETQASQPALAASAPAPAEARTRSVRESVGTPMVWSDVNGPAAAAAPSGGVPLDAPGVVAPPAPPVLAASAPSRPARSPPRVGLWVALGVGGVVVAGGVAGALASRKAATSAVPVATASNASGAVGFAAPPASITAPSSEDPVEGRPARAPAAPDDAAAPSPAPPALEGPAASVRVGVPLARLEPSARPAASAPTAAPSAASSAPKGRKIRTEL